MNMKKQILSTAKERFINYWKGLNLFVQALIIIFVTLSTLIFIQLIIMILNLIF